MIKKLFNTTLVLLVALVFLGVGVFVAKSQGSNTSCVPHIYDASTIPFDYEEEVVQGRILPPVVPSTVDEQLVWIVDEGPLTRVGRACDPDGDPFSVAIVSSSISAEVLVDLQDGTWTLYIPNATPGVHILVISAMDTPSDPDATPKTSYVTVILKVRRGNDAPILD